MRTAVLALTAQGAETARRVQMALPDADVYLSKRAADALADSAQDKAAGDTAATSGSAAAGSDATTGGSAAAGSTATAACRFSGLTFWVRHGGLACGRDDLSAHRSGHGRRLHAL